MEETELSWIFSPKEFFGLKKDCSYPDLIRGPKIDAARTENLKSPFRTETTSRSIPN